MHMKQSRKNSGFTIPETVITISLIILLSALVYTQVGGIYGIDRAAQTKLLLAHLSHVRSEVVSMEQNLGSAPLTAAGLIKKEEYVAQTEEKVHRITMSTTTTLSGSGGIIPTLAVSLVTIAARQLNMHSFDAHNIISEYIPSNISPDYLRGSGINSYLDLDEIMGGKRGYIKAHSYKIPGSNKHELQLFYIVTPFNHAALYDYTYLGEIVKQCNNLDYYWQLPSFEINEYIFSGGYLEPGVCFLYNNHGDGDTSADGIARRYTPEGKGSLVYYLSVDQDYGDDKQTTESSELSVDFYGRY